MGSVLASFSILALSGSSLPSSATPNKTVSAQSSPVRGKGAGARARHTGRQTSIRIMGEALRSLESGEWLGRRERTRPACSYHNKLHGGNRQPRPRQGRLVPPARFCYNPDPRCERLPVVPPFRRVMEDHEELSARPPPRPALPPPP